MGVEDQLVPALWERVTYYTRFMVCQPANPPPPAHPKPRLDWGSIHPVSCLMLHGFSLERESGLVMRVGDITLIGSKLRKHVRVGFLERVLRGLYLYGVMIPIPSTIMSRYFGGCSVEENSVYEVWAPAPQQRVPPTVLVVPPENFRYVTSFGKLLSYITRFVDDEMLEYARVYVVSKYVRLGYLARFMKVFGERAWVELYLAVNEPVLSRLDRRRIEEIGNVKLVPTQSHRKLLLIVYRDAEGLWKAIGFRGSMNVFFPGVDDYLEAANDWTDMYRLIHGIIRAFVIV